MSVFLELNLQVKYVGSGDKYVGSGYDLTSGFK